MRLILVILILLAGCNNVVAKSAKFKVGDCFKPIGEITEFTEAQIEDPILYRKIIKVGKKNYLYEFYAKDLLGEREIELTDEYFDKVKCPKGI